MSKWLDAKQVSEQRGITVSTLQSWRVNGRGPAYHQRNPRARVLYKQEDVDEYFDNNPVIIRSRKSRSKKQNSVTPKLDIVQKDILDTFTYNASYRDNKKLTKLEEENKNLKKALSLAKSLLETALTTINNSVKE
jgi:predicted site-specific integrase-resolvase